MDGNAIVDLDRRYLVEIGEFVDKVGGFVICSYDEGEICSQVRVTNNLVAGAYFYGYTAPGHDCGDYVNSNFRNNIAHSIHGPGVNFFANPSSANSGTCFEGSYFTAYKCTEDGAVTFSATNAVTFSYMTLIDNGWGASMNIGRESDKLTILF